MDFKLHQEWMQGKFAEGAFYWESDYLGPCTTLAGYFAM